MEHPWPRTVFTNGLDFDGAGTPARAADVMIDAYRVVAVTERSAGDHGTRNHGEGSRGTGNHGTDPSRRPWLTLAR